VGQNSAAAEEKEYIGQIVGTCKWLKFEHGTLQVPPNDIT